MSYEKKYLPLNSDIKEEWDEREDRVESEFNVINRGNVKTFTGTLSGRTASVSLPLGWTDMVVIGALVQNPNTVWNSASHVVTKLNSRQSVSVTFDAFYADQPYQITVSRLNY